MANYISIITPCYNEKDNIKELYLAVKKELEKLPDLSYEHIFIDNDSEDGTIEKLRQISLEDKNVKVILNSRNFGHIRSPFHGLLQSRGDASILIAADFQDPPHLISQFVKKWKEGYKIVLGCKSTSQENFLMFKLRSAYYKFLNKVSDVYLYEHFTGFALYDRKVVDLFKTIQDPYPYFRGIVAEVGFSHYTIKFEQPSRTRNITKNNFYTLYDIAMLGLTSHSKVPLRVATILGFSLSVLFFFAGLIYLMAKLFFWDTFSLGQAPLLIGMFFSISVQLFFIGILGEYIGSIHTKVSNRPHVIEKERLNF